MILSPLETFDCYISPRNGGMEFIASEGLLDDCHGVEMKVGGAGSVRWISLTPLPTSESGKEEDVDFIEVCREKLAKKEVAKLFEGPWVHFATKADYVPLMSGNGDEWSLIMVFEKDPGFTKKHAVRYKRLMGVE